VLHLFLLFLLFELFNEDPCVDVDDKTNMENEIFCTGKVDRLLRNFFDQPSRAIGGTVTRLIKLFEFQRGHQTPSGICILSGEDESGSTF
jgi:hypothetical protein